MPSGVRPDPRSSSVDLAVRTLFHVLCFCATIASAYAQSEIPVADVVIESAGPISRLELLPDQAETSHDVPVTLYSPSAPASGHIVELTARTNDCPSAVEIGPLDLDPVAPGAQSSTLLRRGDSKSTTIRVGVSSALDEGVTHYSPGRCTLFFSAMSLTPTGLIDPSPSNNSLLREINFYHVTNPTSSHSDLILSPTSHPETTLRTSLKIPPGAFQSAPKDAEFTIQIEAYPSPPNPLPVSIELDHGTCPASLFGDIDLDIFAEGIQATIDLSSRLYSHGRIVLRAQSLAFWTFKETAPARCSAILKLVAPVSSGDTQASNNLLHLEVDVIDSNDVDSPIFDVLSQLDHTIAGLCISPNIRSQLAQILSVAMASAMSADRAAVARELSRLLATALDRGAVLNSVMVEIASYFQFMITGAQRYPEVLSDVPAAVDQLISLLESSGLPGADRVELISSLRSATTADERRRPLLNAATALAVSALDGSGTVDAATAAQGISLSFALSTDFDPKLLVRHFRKSIRSNRLDRALQSVLTESRGEIALRLSSIPEARRSTIDEFLTLKLRYAQTSGWTREYSMRRLENGAERSFPMRFSPDCDGPWRISGY